MVWARWVSLSRKALNLLEQLSGWETVRRICGQSQVLFSSREELQVYSPALHSTAIIDSAFSGDAFSISSLEVFLLIPSFKYGIYCCSLRLSCSQIISTIRSYISCHSYCYFTCLQDLNSLSSLNLLGKNFLATWPPYQHITSHFVFNHRLYLPSSFVPLHSFIPHNSSFIFHSLFHHFIIIKDTLSVPFIICAGMVAIG